MKRVTWPLRNFPVIRLAGVYPVRVGEELPVYLDLSNALHLHDYEADIKIGGDQFSLAPHDLTVTPCNVVSHYRLKTSGRHLVVHFWKGEEASHGRCQLPIHWSPGVEQAVVRSKLLRIIDLHQQAVALGAGGQILRTAASVALQDILLWLAVQTLSKDGKEPPQRNRSDLAVEHCMQEIESSYAANLSTKALGAKVGLHPDYLAELFRKQFGTTITHAIALRRLRAAQTALHDSSQSIKEVAAACGIADVQNFNKFFHKHLGMSPSKFRRIVQEVRSQKRSS